MPGRKGNGVTRGHPERAEEEASSKRPGDKKTEFTGTKPTAE